MLIIEGATPFFLAHSFWPPARFTSERSKRTTSFWSSARMSALGRSPQLAAAGNRFVGPRDKRPEMTSEPLFRVTETANPSSHPRICAENSDCSPTTGNIQLAQDCVVVAAARIEPVSTLKFPASREFSREFFEKMASKGDSRIRNANSINRL
jgi:hypothetical protein